MCECVGAVKFVSMRSSARACVHLSGSACASMCVRLSAFECECVGAVKFVCAYASKCACVYAFERACVAH